MQTLIQSEKIKISTHTPLAGRDQNSNPDKGNYMYFYSHAPRGARPLDFEDTYDFSKFLLTRPSRGATILERKGHSYMIFLLPRPSRGATGFVDNPSASLSISTHTPLAGRDQDKPEFASLSEVISTHTPLAGRDFTSLIISGTLLISTHTPLAGRDLAVRIAILA